KPPPSEFDVKTTSNQPGVAASTWSSALTVTSNETLPPLFKIELISAITEASDGMSLAELSQRVHSATCPDQPPPAVRVTAPTPSWAAETPLPPQQVV